MSRACTSSLSAERSKATTLLQCFFEDTSMVLHICHCLFRFFILAVFCNCVVFWVSTLKLLGVLCSVNKGFSGYLHFLCNKESAYVYPFFARQRVPCARSVNSERPRSLLQVILN